MPELVRLTNTFVHPQVSACFILSMEDTLVGKRGIMQRIVDEARIFKSGGGSGTDHSPIRSSGEGLTGGGISSGVMSFLLPSDRAAGSIKSGGTTRRAALMRILQIDHPEIEHFINWKVHEEYKAAAMYVGSEVFKMFAEGNLPSEIKHLLPKAIVDRISNGSVPEVISCEWEGEAIETVSGQNSNNSIRVSDEFLRCVDEDKPWHLLARTTGKPIETVSACELWQASCLSAWSSADPGVQFDDAIQAWHTCTADGRIQASNPCSEYLFLNDTACNLASLRLTAFLKNDGSIDDSLYAHICRLVTVILDISVGMASYPTEDVAWGSYNYRTLGIGYADLGGLLMHLGLPYNSPAARALAGTLTALMTGVAYETSAEMAEELGAFPRFEANRESFMKVMQKHRHAINPMLGLELPADPKMHALYNLARSTWDAVCCRRVFRNAQVSLIAPTGTISFVMDCSTTGIEPEFSLVKYKNLAGGGTMRIVNQAVGPALERLGYDEAAVKLMVRELERGGDIRKMLRPEHAHVFDTAQDLSPEAHIYMVAAAQPFLSGAASKTINLPSSATVEDVDRAYRLCHRLGIKAVALYRDGSKLTQPLRANVVERSESEPVRLVPRMPVVASSLALGRGEREYLPWRRKRGYRQKTRIGDGGREQALFWGTGDYPDGRPGELWINVSKQGTMLRSLAECLGVAISIGLQCGVPMEKFVDEFVGVKFEPAGMVEGHDEISFAASIVDLIFRDLAITYCGRDDLRRTVSAAVYDDANQVVALDRGAMIVARGAQPTGEACPSCGTETVQDGRCRLCTNCSWNEGCSG